MNKIALCFFVGLIALSDGGCSYLTSNGRHQAAYARYVRRSSYTRMKLQRRLSASPKLQPPQMQSEPTVATSAGPESVTATAQPAESQN